MPDSQVLINFLIAIFLGALIGLERERRFEAKERASFAGLRTFAIVCLSGAVCGYLSETIGPWIVVAGLVIVGALSIASFLSIMRSCEGNIGTTTELAFICTFLIGVLILIGGRTLGVAVGVTLTVLLSIKTEVRKLSTSISREDMYATLKFGIISLVILPFLPRETFDPYDVLSPYNIWLMVVLVSAISFSGYVATKIFGGQRGLGLTALLGGMWSSTASTMTFSNRCRQSPENFDSYALAVLLACSTMFPRQLIEVYVAGPKMIVPVLLPLGVMGAVGLGISAIWYYRKTHARETEIEMDNPFSLRPALKFAVLYAVVLFISKAASMHYGASGVYVTALLSGLVDVNAITLSAANLVAQDKMAMDVGVKAVVIAAAANTVVKAGITWMFGSTQMFKRVAPWFILILLLGAGAVYLQAIS